MIHGTTAFAREGYANECEIECAKAARGSTQGKRSIIPKGVNQESHLEELQANIHRLTVPISSALLQPSRQGLAPPEQVPMTAQPQELMRLPTTRPRQILPLILLPFHLCGWMRRPVL